MSSLPSLSKRVGRAKARWLKRLMYSSATTPADKALGYAIFDHLNCVTLDCWPAQTTLASLLGWESIKSIQRAAQRLSSLGFIATTRLASPQRYAPIFIEQDGDVSGLHDGQECPEKVDNIDQQSSLVIHSKSTSREEAAEVAQRAGRFFDPRKRGMLEMEICSRLGPDGIEILTSLGSLDDRIVERLCRAQASGFLAQTDLIAARLAAEQMKLFTWSTRR